jgi:cytoskeletal protein CcmA (bactofilin family)
MSDQLRSLLYSPQTTPSNQRPETTSESVIDEHSHFDGLYTTTQDLRIEGTAEGEIMCEGTVTIAEHARATATIRAHTVILSGAAEGNIYCREHFMLQPSGRMNGRVYAASLSIEEGAFFNGEFQMVTDDSSEEWQVRVEEPVTAAAATPRLPSVRDVLARDGEEEEEEEGDEADEYEETDEDEPEDDVEEPALEEEHPQKVSPPR